MFWGSFSGIYAIELSDDGLSIKQGATKVKVAGSHTEGTMVHKRGNYYYLIGSTGYCCRGLDSTYKLVVARSTNILGPYTSKSGGKALDNSFTDSLSVIQPSKVPDTARRLLPTMRASIGFFTTATTSTTLMPAARCISTKSIGRPTAGLQSTMARLRRSKL